MYMQIPCLLRTARTQGQLDFNKAEAGRLRREFERVEAERDRAREEARK